MAELSQFVITGVTVGMVYALVALGFVLIWKSSGVANLALGQLVLVFSWFTYGMLVQTGFPVWLGIPLVILFALGVGWLMERLTLRPLIGQPILSLITVTRGALSGPKASPLCRAFSPRSRSMSGQPWSLRSTCGRPLSL